MTSRNTEKKQSNADFVEKPTCRNFFSLLLFCVFALNLPAQIQQEWYRADTLGSVPGDIRLRIEMSDGVIFAGGREAEGPYVFEPVVTRIDTNGNVVWQYVLPVQGFVVAMRTNRDSTLLVASEIDNNSNADTWGLARLSMATGKPVFEYETPNTDRLYDVCPYDSARFLTCTYDVGNGMSLNLCSSSTGQILSTRTFTALSYVVNDIVLEPVSHDVFVCGGAEIARLSPAGPSAREWVVNYGTTHHLQDGFRLDYDSLTGKLYFFGERDWYNTTAVVARVDTADGTLRWWRPSSNVSTVQYGDHVRIGSQIITTWEHAYIGSGVTVWHINKIDTAGNLIWDRLHTFQPVWPSGACNSSTHYSGTSIDNDASGNLYVGGYYCGNDWGPSNWGMMKLNNVNGTILYQRGFAYDSTQGNLFSEISSINVIGANIYCIGQIETDHTYTGQYGDQHYLKMDPAGNVLDEKLIGQFPCRISATVQIEKYGTDRTLVLRQMQRTIELSMYDYSDSVLWSQRMSTADPLVAYNMNILPNGTICVNAYSGNNINTWQDQMRLETFHTFRYNANGISLGATQGNVPTVYQSYRIIGMVSDATDAYAFYTNYPASTTVRAIRYGAAPLLTAGISTSYSSGGVTLGPAVLTNYSSTSLLLAGLNGRMVTIDKATLTSSSSPANNSVWKYPHSVYRVSATDFLITGFSGSSQATGHASVTRFNAATNSVAWHALIDSNSVVTAACLDFTDDRVFAAMNRTMPGDSGIRTVRINLTTGAVEQTSSTYNHNGTYNCVPDAIVYDGCRGGVYVGGLQREMFYGSLNEHPLVCAFDTALVLGFADIRYGAFRDTNSLHTMCVLNNGSVWAGGGIGRYSNANESYIFALDSATPAVQILVTGSNPACPGDSVVLSATGTGPYLWTTGDTAQSITALTAGIYQVQDASAACALQYSAPVWFSYYAVSVPVVSYTIPDLTVNVGGASYQWYLNGSPLSGAVNQTCTPLVNGTYEAEVTFQNGCTAMSNQYVITDVGILVAPVPNGLTVYPDPASTTVYINAQSASANCLLSLVDVTGKVVLTISPSSVEMMNGITLSVQDIPAGMYFLLLSDDSGVRQQKLLIERE